MRNFKNHPLLSLANGYLINAPQPSYLGFLINFGSLVAFGLVIQIVTGVILAMHYSPSVAEAFNSVEHIMRDVNNGWLIRYLHSNTASAFFFLVYLHVGRGLYYGSYKAPRTLVWIIGTIILILIIATAFLVYVFSLNPLSYLYTYLFFTIILFVLVLMHLFALHERVGYANTLGIRLNYYVFLKFIGVILFLILIYKVFFMICPYYIVYCSDNMTESQLFLQKGVEKAQRMASYWNEQHQQYIYMISQEGDSANRKILEEACAESLKNRDLQVDIGNKLKYQLSQSSHDWGHREVQISKRNLPNDFDTSSNSISKKSG